MRSDVYFAADGACAREVFETPRVCRFWLLLETKCNYPNQQVKVWNALLTGHHQGSALSRIYY